MNLFRIYNILLKEYGYQSWWPVTWEGNLKPEYSGGPKTDKQRLEVAFGAILTQNTSWKNVEKAIINLNRENLIDIEKIRKIKHDELEKIIKPSGFFRQKAERLKIFADFISGKNFQNITRKELLSVKGIGPETADSILLYAFGKPEFVVDSYTERVFERLGLIDTEDYHKIKDFFQNKLPKDTKIYQEFHALIVEHAKRFCRKKPECSGCPLKNKCSYYKTNNIV